MFSKATQKVFLQRLYPYCAFSHIYTASINLFSNRSGFRRFTAANFLRLKLTLHSVHILRFINVIISTSPFSFQFRWHRSKKKRQRGSGVANWRHTSTILLINWTFINKSNLFTSTIADCSTRDIVYHYGIRDILEINMPFRYFI